MKTTFFRLSFVIALCSLFFVGCQKDNLLEGTDYNTLITVKGSNAKTSYNPLNGGVSWTDGDKISVVRGSTSTTNSFAEFTLLDVDDDGTATFGGTIPDDAPVADYVAVYPSQSDLVNDARKVTLTAIRTSQTLKQGSFAEGDNTAMGYNSITTMQFRNVGGLAKIAIRGTTAIKSIRITSNVSGQKLSGKGTIDLQSDDWAIDWVDDASYNYIEAVAPSQSTGFDVSQGNTFYLVLPPCTLSNYTITITDINDKPHSKHYTTPVTISRATVTKFGAFDVDGLAPSFSSYVVPSNEIWYRTASGNVWGPEANSEWQGHTIVSNTYSNGMGKIVLDGNLTSLGNSAISGNNDVTELYLPASFTTFTHYYGVSQMGGLYRLEMPGVESIYMLGLYWLDSMREIVLPASLTSLSNPCLDYMRNLTCVRFMKSDEIYSLSDRLVGAIEVYNNLVATSTDERQIRRAKENVEDEAPFAACPISIIYVPSTLLDDYEADATWSSYMDFLGAVFVGVN